MHHRPNDERRPYERRGDDQEARRSQQIQWSWQITARGATPETILTLFEREGHRFEARNLATTVHRVGKIGGHGLASDTRLGPLAEACRRRIDAFDPLGLANMAWGFAKTGFIEEEILLAIATEARRRIKEFTPQNLTMMLQAFTTFATAGLPAQTLIEVIAADARRRSRQFSGRDMVEVVWGFACARWQKYHIFRELGSPLMECFNDLSQMSMSRLYLATLYVRMHWPSLNFPPSTQLPALRSAYISIRETPADRCKVSALLTEMGWNHEVDHVTQEGFILAMADPEAKRAIQFDDPYHSIRHATNREYVADAETQLKSRLLWSKDWEITHVSFFDWQNKAKGDRRKLLQHHLAKIGVSQSMAGDEESSHDGPPLVAKTDVSQSKKLVVVDEEESSGPLVAKINVSQSKNPVIFDERRYYRTRLLLLHDSL